MRDNVIAVDFRRPRACTRCGAPGPARCATCVDRLRRRANQLHPRPALPDVDLCANDACLCVVFGSQRIAYEPATGRVWCSARCFASSELGMRDEVP